MVSVTLDPAYTSGSATCLSRKGFWDWCSLLPCHSMLATCTGSSMVQPLAAASREEHSPTKTTTLSPVCALCARGQVSKPPMHRSQHTGLLHPVHSHLRSQSLPACSAHANTMSMLSLCTLTFRHTLLGQAALPVRAHTAPGRAPPLHT